MGSSRPVDRMHEIILRGVILATLVVCAWQYVCVPALVALAQLAGSEPAGAKSKHNYQRTTGGTFSDMTFSETPPPTFQLLDEDAATAPAAEKTETKTPP